MSREKADYREIYANMLEHFGKRMVSKTEVAQYLSIDPRTAAKRYGISKNGIMLERLARMLCE